MELDEHEQKYVMQNLELEVINHALNMWRHYLLGGNFILISDHSRLRYLFDQPNMYSRQARWLVMISEFFFLAGCSL